MLIRERATSGQVSKCYYIRLDGRRAGTDRLGVAAAAAASLHAWIVFSFVNSHHAIQRTAQCCSLTRRPATSDDRRTDGRTDGAGHADE